MEKSKGSYKTALPHKKCWKGDVPNSREVVIQEIFFYSFDDI